MFDLSPANRVTVGDALAGYCERVQSRLGSRKMSRDEILEVTACFDAGARYDAAATALRTRREMELITGESLVAPRGSIARTILN